MGQIIRRIGYRRLYLFSLIGFAIAGPAAALAPDIYTIIATRVVVGLACAGISNATLVAVGLLLPPTAQARILGLQGVLGATVAILGFPVIGQLAGLDWRLPFLLHGLALLFIPLVLALPRAARPAEGQTEATLPPARGAGALVVTAAVFAGMVAFIGTISGPLFLIGTGVTDPTLLSLPPTAAAVGSTLGAALYVFIRPRLGLTGCFAFTFAAMALGLAVSGLTGTVWGVTAGAFLSIFGGGAFSPTLYSAAIAASPENPGPTLGLLNALLYGSMILFPLAASPLAMMVGGPRVVILIYAAAAAVLGGMFLLRATRRPSTAVPA